MFEIIKSFKQFLRLHKACPGFDKLEHLNFERNLMLQLERSLTQPGTQRVDCMVPIAEEDIGSLLKYAIIGISLEISKEGK